jgi:drug/metabolite transporter (DMT)-like permease
VTAVALALLAALAYGTSDFAGGVLSRRFHFVAVSVVTQTTSATLVFAALLAGQSGAGLDRATLVWGLTAGLAGAVGGLALYRGLGRGQMAVVGPVSAVGSAALPAVLGAILGEQLSASATAGVVLALPAIWLVARVSRAPGHLSVSGLIDGIVAGSGFGMLFIGLERAGNSAGLWAVALSQGMALVIIAVLALSWPAALGTGLRASLRAGLWKGLAPGALLAGAVIAYHRAAVDGLTVAAVLTSLYPAVTVLLAAVVLKEHIGRTQRVGLALSLVAVFAIASG